MAKLSSDLKELGYDRTERASPFDENGTLWTNSYELVCDETGFVLRKDVSKWKLEDDGTLTRKEEFIFPDLDEEDD